MRLLTSSILLSLSVLAASCSKNQYAQVEPDDLYFTHKDRKEAVGGTTFPTSPIITNVEPAETPTEYRSDYSDSHSPVFTAPSYGSPTIQSPTLGSPTIQQYEQQPYYDTSVNPDYLYEEDYTDLEGASSEYYNEEYAYQGPPVYETPQVNNYYYGLPANTYMPMSAMMGIGVYSMYRPMRYSSMFMYDPYYSYWNNNYGWWNSNWNDPYGYNQWCDPFNPSSGYYVAYNRYYIGGAQYYGYYDNGTTYADGTKVVTKPRQSRSQASYEVDKSNLPIKSRRADYIPRSGEESGRVASRTTNARTRVNGEVKTGYTRRGNSPTYTSGTVDRNGATVTRRNNNGTSVTVKDNRRSDVQRNRTVVVPTKTRTSYTNRSTAGQQRDSRAYNANRSNVKRSGTPNRSGGTTRYSTRTTNAKRSSYGTRSSSGNRSNTSYRSGSSNSRSSGTRSSYSSGRSSSRSYSAPSRSSGSSGRSYSPSRSSSSRSSGTRSSSSGRSSGRKN